ncbi:MAG TPA: monovalent cation/H(+) antiporter subunit G [Kofleriaceae bacterium]|nr:monovalent cation/H(+) antiporter subunit G [Kofleriaceae bacterium]
MTVIDVVATALWVVGAVFFFAGTVGLLRFPDVYTRLHALTKPDNVGLGFIVSGLAIQSSELAVALKVIAIWVLLLVVNAVSCQVIARATWNRGIRPWSRR